MTTPPIPAHNSPAISTAKPLRVMLVDDHELILAVIGRLIRRERPALELVGTARNSEEALQLTRTASVDVIVLDVDLGGESGIDLIPKLAELCPAKVVMFSALDNLFDKNRAAGAGAIAYVSKLDPANALLDAIYAAGDQAAPP